MSPRGQAELRDRIVSGTALLNHHFIKRAFLDAWKAVVLDDRKAVFAALVDRLDEVAARQGELRLTIPMVYVEAQAA